MKFLSVAVAGAVSTFCIGATALPMIAKPLTNEPNDSPAPFHHIGIPEHVPENCGMHCPVIAKRSSTPKPIAISDSQPTGTYHGPEGITFQALQREKEPQYNVGLLPRTEVVGDEASTHNSDGQIHELPGPGTSKRESFGILTRAFNPMIVCARNLLASGCCAGCPQVSGHLGENIF